MTGNNIYRFTKQAMLSATAHRRAANAKTWERFWEPVGEKGFEDDKEGFKRVQTRKRPF